MKTSRDNSTLSWRFQPVTPSIASQINEVWQFRDLLPTLLRRAIFLVYPKATLGAGWMIINTVVITLPFAIIVSRIFNLDTGGLPPAVFALSGFAVWTLFRTSTQWMTKALAINKAIVKNFNIPPLLLLSAMMSMGLLAFVIVTGILIGSLIYVWVSAGLSVVSFGWNLLLVIPVIILTLALALGVSGMTSILFDVTADAVHVSRYVFTAWMFASPVFYSVTMFDEKYRIFFYFNPLTGLIESFRWALFRSGDLNLPYVSISLVLAVAITLMGTLLFIKLQRRVLNFD